MLVGSISSPASCSLTNCVVRLVVVEALHHVIAIAIGVGTVHVVLVAVGLGEAHHVQPVAAPLLAIMRRGEQAVHHFLPGFGRLVATNASISSGWAEGR